MENKKDVLLIILSLIIVFLTVKIIETKDDFVVQTVHLCKEDSLKSLVNDLLMQKEIDEDGWDKKEIKYEQILFEYNYGLDHLKNYQPEAYKEFHRILGHKEQYTHETERENKKRLYEYNR